jgi:hypothetical protein
MMGAEMAPTMDHPKGSLTVDLMESVLGFSTALMRVCMSAV